MFRPLIITAVTAAFAATAGAAPSQTPNVLSVVHEDFLLQLDEVARTPGAIGAAARTAADLMAAHNAAEETLILPFLAHSDAVAAAEPPVVAPQTLASMERLQAELPGLIDAQTEVVIAAVELFAAADIEGRADIARLAERIIWHEMGDAEVLYPAAALVATTARERVTGVVLRQ
jgi:hypothetical protein